ncbi:MAG: deoxynucleoside kinase, partial [Fusobacteriaceae bacterium]
MYYKDFFEKLKIGGIKMRTVICIDGVVGVGKSTVGDLLAQELNTRLFVEPVIDNPLLDKFYYDRKQYAFPLQVFFLNKRFEMIKDAEKFESCIMDRSIYGDVIFARMLMEDGDMSSDEFKIYEELLTHMLEHIELPKLMI